MSILVLQRILLEFLFDFLYFPLWWYAGGMKKAAIFSINLVRSGNMSMAPGLWLKNIFVPMFGQTDFQGRVTSFFMRSANVVIRSIGLLIWTMIAICIFLIWPIFPVFVIYMFGISFM